MFGFHPTASNGRRARFGRPRIAGNAGLVRKPGRLPMLVIGNSGQSVPWMAERADGSIAYRRGIDRQAEAVRNGAAGVRGDARPLMSSDEVEAPLQMIARPVVPRLPYRRKR